MSPSSEKFTLLESGTSRLHFKLAKQLEDEGSTRRQDLVILETVAHIRKQLASRSIYSDVSNLTSALVTLLHCLQHYPRSATSLSGSATLIDTSFALLPTLQLLSLATSWKHLLIAHQLLPFLLPVNAPNNVTQDATSPFTRSSSRSSRGQIPTSDDSTSLFLLNTFRANLSAASDYPRPKALRHNTSSSARSRSRSSSNPRSLPESDSSSSINVRALASLKALVTGTLRGSAVLPSLATTLVDLTRHPDSSIRSMTMCAMLSCAEVSTTESTDSDGQTEILDAVLTIVRLTQASAYAFSVGSNLEENHGMILEEMEKRVDSSPKVLRTCIKIVNYARTVGLISAKEAACHAIEALQAARWAPMHLELTALQQRQVVTSVLDRTEGLRARKAARQRASLQVEHDYHGTYAPWLVQACLSSLVDSIESMNENVSQQLDGMTRRQLLKVVLRIYDIASRGRAAALLLCISAARCIAALYRAQTPLSGPAGDDDGELAILWNKLSAHIKSQLHNTNPNRKVAGIDLLSALLPLGWAQTTSEGEGQTSPLQITEAELGQLMVMLADADASVRKRALTLLHRVDPKLITLLRLQLQNAVKDAIDARKDEQGNYIRAQHDVPLAAEAQRLVEVAQFAISIQREPELQTACESEEAMSALEDSLVSAISLGLFGNFDGDRTASASAWTISTLISISCLSMAQRIHLLQRLMAHVVETNSTSESQERSYLCCRLLVDLRVHDLHEHGPAVNSFVQWVDSDLLSSHGLSTVLVKSSGDDRVAVAARETILGIAARMISLVVNIYGLQSSKHLSSGLAALQSTLSQLIETELVAAVRLEACNLLLVCETLLDPLCPGYEELIVKLKEIAISSHTLQDSTRSLLELQLEDSSPLRAGDTRGSLSIFSSRSLLATASQFFTPSSDPTLGASAPSDSFAAVRLRAQLPDSILHSSRLLSPEGSTDTLRSSKQPAPLKRSIVRKGRLDFAVDQLPSAIPPESKRLRDRNIAQAMSDSIANLVLGSEAKGRPLDNEVIFSVTSSGIMDSDIQELDLVHEVADPERRLDGIGAEGETPSLLDLVHQCHNHEPWLDTSLTPFVLDGVQIGFLQDRVVKACMDDSAEQIRAGSAAVLRKVRFSMDHREIMPPTCSSRVCEAISFTSDFATPEARTVGLNAVAQRWRQARIFRDPLDGWRDELYAIYALNPRPGSRNPIAFKLERAACALFGFATFGVHLTAYSVAPGTGELKVWVPQRSLTKSTWPGYLDNSVAGGIVAGDLPMESMVRECEEEANLESSLVEKHIKQTGVLSYCYKTAKQGWIQPEVEYVYDLPLPPEVTLQPKDGEVDHFELLTLDEIYNKMSKGKFKPNCVLVMLDFLIRHGHITADTEPGYRQIVAQLHVDLRLPGP